MICLSLKFVWRSEIFSIYQRLAAVLLPVEVADEGERIVRLVFVGRGLYTRADDDDAENGESDDDDCRA